jgi:transposase InsO family protein
MHLVLHDLPVADNLLGRQFEPAAVNRAWVADITYIPTGEGWLYLAAVEDLYSRQIVGWSMGEHLGSRLVVDALEMAVARRLPGEGLSCPSTAPPVCSRRPTRTNPSPA